jgi:hypothetical protein
MVRSFTSKSNEYNKLNLQLYYIEEIAKLISRIGNLLSLSEGYSVSAFRQAYGKILTLRDLIIGAKLSFHERDQEIFRLYMLFADKLENHNIREGTQNLRRAYELLIKVTKQNHLIFPQKIRAGSFKSFVEEEAA